MIRLEARNSKMMKWNKKMFTNLTGTKIRRLKKSYRIRFLMLSFFCFLLTFFFFLFLRRWFCGMNSQPQTSKPFALFPVVLYQHVYPKSQSKHSVHRIDMLFFSLDDDDPCMLQAGSIQIPNEKKKKKPIIIISYTH